MHALYSFVVSLVGVKQTRAIKTQRYKRFDNTGLILLTTCKLLDIPYNKVFCVEESVVAKALNDTHISLDLTFEVRWLQNTILKGPIEAGTNPEVKKWTVGYHARIKAVCAQYAQQQCAGMFVRFNLPV